MTAPTHTARLRGRALAVGAVLAVLVAVPVALVVARHGRTTPSAPSADPTVTGLIAAGHVPPPTRPWSRLPDLPLSPRHDVLGVWLDGEAVFVGGSDAVIQFAPTPTLDDGAAYDPATGRWRSISSAPEPVDAESPAAVAGGRLLVLAESGRWLSYDPGDDAWRTYRRPPTTVRGARAALQDGRLYVVDRYGTQRLDPLVQALDLARGTWSRLPPLPTARTLEDRDIVATGDGLVVLSDAYDDRRHGVVHGRGEDADVWDGTAWRRLPRAPVGGSQWRWDGHDVVASVRTSRVLGDHVLPTGTLDPTTGTWTSHGYGPSAHASLDPTRGSSLVPVGHRVLAGGYLYDLATRTWRDVPDRPPGTTGGTSAVLTPDGILVLAAATLPPDPDPGPPSPAGPPTLPTPQLWSLDR